MKFLQITLLALITFLLINVSNAKENKKYSNLYLKKYYAKHSKSYYINFEESSSCSEESSEDESLIRRTKFGPVEGIIETDEKGNDVLVWYGIPYGASPVGELRWAAPQNPKPWTDTLNCTAQAPIALQMSSNEVVGSEDCLNLDIYAPRNAKNLPVFVYIHGGNNQTGHSKELIGNEIVIKENCIYISINYRLGIFGFNNLPALQTKAGSTGNYALLDMAKALDWIKANVSRFGGNPNNVTLTGFSAGGRDVMAMLISPLFANKFEKAIVFSGGMTLASKEDGIKRIASALAPLAVEDNVAKTEEEAKAWLKTDAKEVKDWLYSVSSERLCALMGNAGIRMSVFPHLFIDDFVIPKEGFDTKKWNNVPVIMLTGSTEFSFFNMGASLYTSNKVKDGEKAKEFGCYYGSDMYRIFNAQISAEKMFNVYKSNIYICQVEYGSRNSATPLDTKAPFHNIGSFHGIFIPFLSSTIHGYTAMSDFDEAGYKDLAELFNKQLKNFLRRGNPNGSGLPLWERWTPKKPFSMVLDAKDGKQIAVCKDVSTTYDEIFENMEKDNTISNDEKDLIISEVMNGRWFSGPLDEHYGTPSLWDQYN